MTATCLWLCMGIIISVCYSESSVPAYKTYYYTQRVDHFDPQNVVTFQQRYLIYDDIWYNNTNKKNGTIFFYAGNEGDITEFWNNTGFMFDIASQFNALIVFMEHRYYGISLPFGSDSFQRNNLRYLTMENAIRDYATFITDIKSKYNAASTPVITFGGSYGAILAILLRIHYPNLFNIALAASGPIYQTLYAVNGSEFFEFVTKDYQNVNNLCPQIIRNGYTKLLDSFNNKQYDIITNTFNLCSPIQSYDNNVTLLIEWSRSAFLVMAMVDYPYNASFMGSLPANPVNKTCDIILSNKNNPMLALGEAAGFFYNSTNDFNLKCYNLTQEFIPCADPTGCTLGEISWDYQMCTQITAPFITNNITDMFPPSVWTIDNTTKYCIETYSVKPEVEWMQQWFPLDINATSTSNIIFSNGLLDPWRSGGITTNLSDDLPAILIKGGAHHLDLRGANPKDPQSVIDARNKEVQYFKKWLNWL